MDWKDIEKVNAEIETIKIETSIKDKATGEWRKIVNEYVPVSERVIAFRKLFPKGQLITEPTFTENYVMFEAVALDENGMILAKGHAREISNKSFSMENCETSAIGRCLGLLGIGTKAGIASKEDIEHMEDETIFDDPVFKSNVADLAKELSNFYTKAEIVQILNTNQITRLEDLGKVELNKLINLRKYGG